jgi:hypothetical protein
MMKLPEGEREREPKLRDCAQLREGGMKCWKKK